MDIIFLEYFSWIWRLLGYDSVSLIKIILLLCHYHILSVSWTQVFSIRRVGSGILVLQHLVLLFSRHYMFSRGTQRRPLSCYQSDQIELTMSLFYCKVRTVNVQQLLPCEWTSTALHALSLFTPQKWGKYSIIKNNNPLYIETRFSIWLQF